MATVNTIISQAKNKAFQEQAQNILDRIQDLVENYDVEKINQNLKRICQDFSNFYDKFYEKNVEYYQQGEEWKNIIEHMKNMQRSRDTKDEDISIIENFMKDKRRRKIRQIIVSKITLTKQLQSLLTGFKTLFLKTLNKTFVQMVVFEDQGKQFEPAIIKINNFNGLSSFIKSSANDFQGKLMSNNTILQQYNNNQDKYQKIEIDQSYIDIYKQTRRRLNIFYEKAHRPSYGESLLLYHIQKWYKFWINNLGDVKQGFIAMSLNKGNIDSNMQKNIQMFTTFIGKVDNTPGTLLQDIQQIQQIIQDQIELQISSKSGAAKTGSHKELINLIKNIANSNNGKALIEEIFTKDAQYSKKQSGQRNRLLDDEKDKDKLQRLLSDGITYVARTSLDQIMQNIDIKI